MSRRSAVSYALVAVVIMFASSCGGPAGGGAPAGGSPAGGSPARGGNAASSSVQQAPIRTFSGGTATVTIKVGDQTFSYKGGECQREKGGDVLSVNIGEVLGENFFGFGVGRNPGEYEAPEAAAARSVKGGGQFAGRYELIISIVHDGKRLSPAAGSANATIAPGVESGQFSGTTQDGQRVSGSFRC